MSWRSKITDAQIARGRRLPRTVSYLVAVSVDFTDALRDKVADRCGVHGRVLLTHRRDCCVLAPRVEKPRPSVSIPPLAAGRAWTRTFLLAREPPAAGLRRHTAPRALPMSGS